MPRARMMRGAGEAIGPALGLAPMPGMLINPGVPVETAPVFRALGLTVGQRHGGDPHPDISRRRSAIDVLVARSCPARNDLEAPALHASLR